MAHFFYPLLEEENESLFSERRLQFFKSLLSIFKTEFPFQKLKLLPFNIQMGACAAAAVAAASRANTNKLLFMCSLQQHIYI
jgi:hypothetical protein